MQKTTQKNPVWTRAVALTTCGAVLLPTLVGCGGQSAQTTQQAPGGFTGQQGQAPPSRPQQGLSGKQKLVLVAGAAALYYYFRKSQAANNRQAQGGAPRGVQLYQSKNGGIYYRDPQNPQKITYVSPPRQAVQIPAEEAQRYGLDQYQGYDNGRTGRTFGGYGYGAGGGQGVPAGAVPFDQVPGAGAF